MGPADGAPAVSGSDRLATVLVRSYRIAAAILLLGAGLVLLVIEWRVFWYLATGRQWVR